MNLPPELEAALLGNSIVYMRGRLDETLANVVIPQLLLASRTAVRPVALICTLIRRAAPSAPPSAFTT